jgi:hypothetical protein
MAVTQEFRQALKDKDVRLIRIMLEDNLVVDPTFTEFNELLALAEAELEGLYDEHDDEALNYDRTAWTKDYMDDQMVKVVYNFSKERLELLKSICKYRYKDRIAKIEADRTPMPSNIKITKKQIGGGIAVGGAVTVVAGAVIAKPVIIGVGLAAVVVGGIIIATDK